MADLITAARIISRWPRKNADKEKVLRYLAAKFEPERLYPEKEVNAILNAHHNFGPPYFQDCALLRRELFDRGFLNRDPAKGIYWKTEMSKAEA